MHDREKVIEHMNDCLEASRADNGWVFVRKDIIADALDLLKEQEAVEPIITPCAEDEDGNIVVAKRECGKCGYQFFTERPNFCENCGTPILWEGR